MIRLDLKNGTVETLSILQPTRPLVCNSLLENLINRQVGFLLRGHSVLQYL